MSQYGVLKDLPSRAVFAVFDDDMHRFELVADGVGCSPVAVGARLSTLGDQLFDLRDVYVG